MGDGDKYNGLFDADESAEDEITPDFSSDAEPDVYKDGRSYDAMWGQALNKQSDYGDDYENGGQRLFGGLAKKVKDNRDKKKADAKDSAKDRLKQNEKNASKDPNQSGRGGDKDASLGEKEENIESDTMAGKYVNAVKGIEDIKKGKIGRGSSRLKKAGPAIAILAIMFGFGGMSFFSVASLPTSLMSQLENRFDFNGVTMKLRSRNFLKYQTSKGYVKDCRKVKIFKGEVFKPTKSMTKRLAAQGIEFDDVGGVKVMKYKGKTIVADADDAVNGRIYFDDAFNNDVDFQKAYTDGSRTWRGSVASWFDSKMDGFLKKIGIDRNLWREYKSGKNKKADGSSETDMSTMRKTISGVADSDEANGKMKTSKIGEIEEQDVEGNVTGKKTTVKEKTNNDISFGRADVETDSSGKITNTDALKGKLEGVADNIDSLKKVSSAANLATNLVCGAADFVAAVSGIIAAYQSIQVIKTASAVFEAFQKAKVGDGDTSPINEVARSLMQPVENSYEVPVSVKKEGDKGIVETKTITRTKSSMQAEASNALYRGNVVDANDLSVKSFNINNSVQSAYKGIASIMGKIDGVVISAASFAACTQARVAAAAAGAVTDAVELLGCAAAAAPTYGAALLGCLAGEIAENAAFSGAATLIISTMIGFLVPWVAHTLIRNIATQVVGEDLMTAIMSAGNKMYGQQFQWGGGSIATKDMFAKYLKLQNESQEEVARYERATRSPFDLSSQYTFLGSLATKLVPVTSSMYSTASFINSLGDLFSDSVASLTPHSAAVEAGIRAELEYEATKKNCPDVYAIGGVADAGCDPYFISDLSTIDTHPATNADSISDDDLRTDAEGNPEIVENSMLAKYIIYCGQRSSPWGRADQNIMTQVSLPNPDDFANTEITAGDFTVSPLSAATNSLPVIGDVLDIVDGGKKVANMGWITGASCVTGYEADIKETETVSWSTEKKYQRLIGDLNQAELEGRGKSAVSDFLNSYYKKHPLDNSPEGILARYSGLTKENVIATLDTLDLMDFMAEYDPSDYYPYIVEKEEATISLTDGNNDIGDGIITLIPHDYCISSRKEAYIS